ncbi:DUF488 domain-containing protein [Pelotomaculum terephthalicicum JT]|uniref:DUF488 domain-containing protein n=1 Tax=Pelotomaculum TaxID=191373 RepID=UPI0009C8D30F|nr:MULTISPECIES: DUF488 domain-containing protein [Pelotomaculum]MCG9969832.1 DUF488 domain-containing protein [Pelotomaculum terephthalicicum JT]OPX85318.1 MAG: hypothetical protein A4E54_02473 [Pelotomaculum sp. PtaB.Bin117]OPY62389.1 MAG: hypothetical protein A4E56_01386 [Pelotomaculum sp. PtaU1.Bin065]
MNKIYTIGHSSHKLENFLHLLKIHSINCLIDVRSMPHSKYTPQFNKDELRRFLLSNSIHYIFMGNEFGARREDKSLYTKEGYLDFDKVTNTSLFKAGIERIKTGIKKDFKIALMCTEKDPIDCHRNILIAREFHKLDYSIDNILENGEIQNQDFIEKRLLDMYFPNRMQQTLFDIIDGRKNDSELIDQAYKLRNRDIGYSIVEKESLTS